jgi:hypothetical protein
MERVKPENVQDAMVMGVVELQETLKLVAVEQVQPEEVV